MAFVEFYDSNQQTEFLKRMKKSSKFLGQITQEVFYKLFPHKDSLLFKGSSIKISRAPEPSDILWSNCEKKFSFKRLILVWLMTFLMISISFGALVLIGFLRKTFPALNSLSILISISLQLFNRIIWNTLVALVSLENNNTKTDMIVSVMTKSSFAAAINVILLPIITNILLKNNLYGPEGLIGIVLDYQFTSLFMMFNFQALNVPYQIQKITLCIPFIRNYIIRKKVATIGDFAQT